jgi:hypothetical protein
LPIKKIVAALVSPVCLATNTLRAPHPHNSQQHPTTVIHTLTYTVCQRDFTALVHAKKTIVTALVSPVCWATNTLRAPHPALRAAQPLSSLAATLSPQWGTCIKCLVLSHHRHNAPPPHMPPCQYSSIPATPFPGTGWRHPAGVWSTVGQVVLPPSTNSSLALVTAGLMRASYTLSTHHNTRHDPIFPRHPCARVYPARASAWPL